MKRYIFLDIDGVLSTKRSQRACVASFGTWRDACGPFFDAEAVRNLRAIVERTEAEVVITSTWRFLGEERMQEMWASRQLDTGDVVRMPGVLAGATPEAPFASYAIRGQEIAAYLAQHVEEDEECRYVIIDDGRDFLPEQFPFCVFTDPEVGISEEDAGKAALLIEN